MSNMSGNEADTARRARRSGVIAGLIVAVATLAGCSSSGSSEDTAATFMSDGGGEAAAYSEGDAALEEAAETEAGAEPGSGNRSLIVTGSLYITVEEPLGAADEAADIVQSAGGRVDARDETAPDEYDGGSASLTLRIPEDELDPVVDDLRELGTVDHFATESRDVTTQVTDLEARISTLRASTDRIQLLLIEAEDIGDVIALEDELASRQGELESLVAQQRGLTDQVSMSTIELSLTTEPVVLVDDSPRTFIGGLTSGWDGLVTFISGALVVTGVLLPWLAVAGLIAAVAIVSVRAWRSRRGRHAPAADAQAADARIAESGSTPRAPSAP